MGFGRTGLGAVDMSTEGGRALSNFGAGCCWYVHSGRRSGVLAGCTGHGGIHDAQACCVLWDGGNSWSGALVTAVAAAAGPGPPAGH